MMGNALVVGLVERVGRELMDEIRESQEPARHTVDDGVP